MGRVHGPRFVAITDAAKANITEITAEVTLDWRSAGRAFYLVDVREDREWSAGRCAGAIHIGRGVLERDIEATISQLDAHIVLYCGGGYRSALAADALGKMGYTEVWSLAGGIRRWRELGLPEDR